MADLDGDGLTADVDPDDTNIDTDGDGIFDLFDVDVDGDGIDDNGVDSDNDGINDMSDVNVSGGIDSNGDGIDDSILDPTDMDNDGLPGQLDPDDDNWDIDGDGLADADDNPTDGLTDIGEVDSDGDGIVDAFDRDEEISGVLIPTGFSPNDDGYNDTWMIDGLEEYPGSKLTIFNRWGHVIYSKNYEMGINDWDGTNVDGGLSVGNGKLPDGTYFYVLILNEEGEEPRAGYLQIAR